MAGCILFAFAAVGEFVICKVIKGYHDKSKNKVSTMPLMMMPRSLPTTIPNPSPPQDQPSPITNNNNNNNNNNNTIGPMVSFRRPNSYHKPWPPSSDVETGATEDDDDDVPPSKITRLNGREIGLSRSVPDASSLPGYLSSNREGSTNKKRPRDSVEEPIMVKSPKKEPIMVKSPKKEPIIVKSPMVWGQMMESKVKPRKKWLKTMKDLEMQWDDPKTGDVKILWEEIDITSRVLFPVVFFIFASIYFPFLMLL